MAYNQRQMKLASFTAIVSALQDAGVASDLPPDIDWSLTTWEGARREQLRRWAALPLGSQRLPA
jgi:hypothetical protein